MNEEHSQRLQRPAPMMDCASDVVSKPEPPERDVGLNMKLSPFGRDIPFMKMPPCLPFEPAFIVIEPQSELLVNAVFLRYLGQPFGASRRPSGGGEGSERPARRTRGR